MPLLSKLVSKLPPVWSAVLALVSSLLLAASFPDSEIALLGWVAFVPILISFEIDDCGVSGNFLKGWLFGTVFFFITCWWLTFAPITYAGFPVIPTYFLLLGATAASGVFAGFFSVVYGRIRRAAGPAGILAAPMIWAASEFARYWITGNNWNAVGYSQAFTPALMANAEYGGVLLTGAVVVSFSAVVVFVWSAVRNREAVGRYAIILAAALVILSGASLAVPGLETEPEPGPPSAKLVAVQPNVPMAGLTFEKWRSLRERQAELARNALADAGRNGVPVTVVLPESPMNYQYDSDPEFRRFMDEFAGTNEVSVLFNSAEPDPSRERGFFNSAVIVGPKGGKAGQYDKIYLLPFGEFVPLPEFAQHLIPPMVGRFSRGTEYDLLDVGGAKAGVMICFESHFGSLSGEYADRGADLLIEMTNDGYLGDTPVLRQHLANAVFRAVETGLPLYRVTNVGITAKIDGRGRIEDIADTYTEATRVWEVRKTGAGGTLYSRWGDWFGVLCALFTVVGLGLTFRPTAPKGQLM